MLKPFKYLGATKNLKGHLKKVVEGNEYNFGDIQFNHNPTVLDLGANIGAYTYWILNKIPNAYVIAFEPIRETAEYYIKNMQESGAAMWSYCIVNAAVHPTKEKEIDIFLSKINSGMNSLDKNLTNTEDAQTYKARVCHPDFLPNCDILKMDIEGSELPVLEAYLKRHAPPSVISFEYHCFGTRYDIENLLEDYVLASGLIIKPDMGTLNFVHKDVLNVMYETKP